MKKPIPFGGYRTMWLMVMFDLPTDTRKQEGDIETLEIICFKTALICSSFLFMQDIHPVKKMQPCIFKG